MDSPYCGRLHLPAVPLDVEEKGVLLRVRCRVVHGTEEKGMKAMKEERSPAVIMALSSLIYVVGIWRKCPYPCCTKDTHNRPGNPGQEKR